MTQRRTPAITFHDPAPVRISRSLVLRSPRLRTVTAPDGTTTTGRALRQRLVPGNLVVVAVPQRTSYQPWWPEAAHNGRSRLSTFSPLLAIVHDVSPNGRMFRLRTLLTSSNSIVRIRGVTGEIVWRHRWTTSVGIAYGYAPHNRGDDVYTEHPQGDPPTLDEARTYLSSGFLNTDHHAVARTSHILRVVAVDELPDTIIRAMREEARAATGANLLQRLSDATLAGQPVDRSGGLGRSARLIVHNDTATRRDYSLRISSTIKAARRFVEHGRPDTAIAYIREAIQFALQARQYLATGVVRTSSWNNPPNPNSDAAKEIRRKIVKAVSSAGTTFVFNDCGHVTAHRAGWVETEAPVRVADTFGSEGYVRTMGTACAACRANYLQDVVMRDGSIVPTLTNLISAFAWDDGTFHEEDQPRVIMGYHSSKEVVGYTAPLKPHNGDWPTIGFELEVEARDETAPEAAARKIRALVEEKFASPKQAKRYLNFEHDGSLSEAGFEIVSGWTDLATHAEIMKHVMLDEHGKNRWVGQLRSHNASCSCGLHVHIQKPTSLVHAAKVRYFMSSPIFRDLVKAVARRYNTSYAHVAGYDEGSGSVGGVNSPDFDKPQVCAAKYLKQRKRRGVTAKDVVRGRMRLNDNRYEHANFHNDNTVEIRVFRGTTVYRTFMACLELTQAVWMYCRDTAASSMTVDTFLAYINRVENGRETRNLRELLGAKGFAVRLPKPKKDAAITAPVDDVQAEEVVAA